MSPRKSDAGRDAVVVERDGAIGWIRMNRPERLNAFAGDMRERIEAALRAHEADPEVRCVVVTGEGRAFSTGGDVSVMAELQEQEDAARFEALVRAGMRIVSLVESMGTPVIAAVNGPAAGAAACLALACDLRVASEGASIGFAFLRVGLHPDWGGSYFLPRLVGPALAAELIYTGGMISADRGERLGLFNRVVPADELENAVRALAGQIAAGPPEVVRAVKHTLRHAVHASLADVLEMELRAQLDAFDSEDGREGVRAFLEKRTPRFGGG